MNRLAWAVGLGLAATGAPAAALDPEVTLSGAFGASLSWFESSSDTGSFSDVDLENNASNFRISAAASEIGLRAFIAYERGASNDQVGVEDVREFFGGVSGAWGTVLYGRKATDYRLAGARLDPFYNTSLAGHNGRFASEGGSYGLSNYTNGFTSNTIAVRSTAWQGFLANGAAYVNDNDSQSAGGDEADYALGAEFSRSEWWNLEVGLQALDVNGRVVANAPGEGQAYRAHGSIGQGLWAAGASWELVDVDTEADPRQYGFVAASYQLLEALRLAAAYGHVGNSPSFDGNGVTLGLFYELTRNLTLYGGARHVTLDNAVAEDDTTAAAGARFVFEVGL